MKRKLFNKLITAASLTALFGVASAADPIHVGYVYADAIGDYGWTYQHDLARKKVEKSMGKKISSDYVFTSKATAKSALEIMTKNDYDIIFVTSVSLKQEVLKAARNNPKIRFASCNSEYTLDNLEGYAAKYNEGFYLAGIASATVSKAKVIGAIGISHIPLIYRNINAFTLGAQTVDPDIKVKAIWIDARDDTDAEAKAVRTLKAQGADVILQQTINPTVLTTAEEEDVWVVGFNGDAKTYAPTKYITSVINDWSNYYERTINAFIDNRWKSGNVWGGFKERMVTIKPMNPVVPKETEDKINELRLKMINSNFQVFRGPVSYADGEVLVNNGEVPSYNQMMDMTKFVKGVEDISELAQ